MPAGGVVRKPTSVDSGYCVYDSNSNFCDYWWYAAGDGCESTGQEQQREPPAGVHAPLVTAPVTPDVDRFVFDITSVTVSPDISCCSSVTDSPLRSYYSPPSTATDRRYTPPSPSTDRRYSPPSPATDRRYSPPAPSTDGRYNPPSPSTYRRYNPRSPSTKGGCGHSVQQSAASSLYLVNAHSSRAEHSEPYRQRHAPATSPLTYSEPPAAGVTSDVVHFPTTLSDCLTLPVRHYTGSPIRCSSLHEATGVTKSDADDIHWDQSNSSSDNCNRQSDNCYSRSDGCDSNSNDNCDIRSDDYDSCSDNCDSRGDNCDRQRDNCDRQRNNCDSGSDNYCDSHSDSGSDGSESVQSYPVIMLPPAVVGDYCSECCVSAVVPVHGIIPRHSDTPRSPSVEWSPVTTTTCCGTKYAAALPYRVVTGTQSKECSQAPAAVTGKLLFACCCRCHR